MGWLNWIVGVNAIVTMEVLEWKNCREGQSRVGFQTLLAPIILVSPLLLPCLVPMAKKDLGHIRS